MSTSSSVLNTEASRDTDEEHVYYIANIIESESAFIYIAHESNDRTQTVVLKVLRAYKDERYHYDSQEKRLTCQKEALRKNLEITQNIYQGLRRILQPTLQELEEKKSELHTITLGNLMRKSDQIEHLSEQGGEYALVMSYLPEKQRLDLLLQVGSTKQQEEFLLLLVKRVEQMHKDFLPLDDARDEDGNLWGSNEQLSKKLVHNLSHFDLIKNYEPALYEQYHHLKDDLQGLMQQAVLQKAFERRQDEYVKQCHGDLKTKNIWIETIKQDNNLLQHVRILDAVDFNESYRNIDVLADLAMLAVDVMVYKSKDLGVFFIEKYLDLVLTGYSEEKYHAGQIAEKYLVLTGHAENDAAKIVLAYYLLEKAIVCAIVSLVYDHSEKQLGEGFLRIADEYAKKLGGMLKKPHLRVKLAA